jgi:hypothetical protein
MNSFREKAAWLAMLILIPAGLAFAQTATLVDFKGKVELMKPGAAWAAAVKGMRIDKGMTISTGFNSSATLQLGDSIVLAKALTRLTLDELVRKENTVQTSLNLRVGKVRAEVKSSQGLAQDFKLKSPVSTAAVRGTTIEGDGENTVCIIGTVSVSNAAGQARTIGGGEQTKVSGSDAPKAAEQTKAESAAVPAAPVAPQTVVAPPPIVPPGPTTGGLTIQMIIP